jgi:hypothetical protein
VETAVVFNRVIQHEIPNRKPHAMQFGKSRRKGVGGCVKSHTSLLLLGTHQRCVEPYYSASKHRPAQSVKFLAAREHIDNQLYALDLRL